MLKQPLKASNSKSSHAFLTWEIKKLNEKSFLQEFEGVNFNILCMKTSQSLTIRQTWKMLIVVKIY